MLVVDRGLCEAGGASKVRSKWSSSLASARGSSFTDDSHIRWRSCEVLAWRLRDGAEVVTDDEEGVVFGY
jgi:hypothetical protein